MNYPYKKSQTGFTLIELLVVIAIVGVLSGVVFQSLQSARYKSQNATRLSDVDQIAKATHLYLSKTNASFPASIAWDCIGAASCWGGTQTGQALDAALAGNISKIPKDPVITAGNGDYYLYNSAYTGTYGTGAYLDYYVNNTGAKPCGRGYAVGVPTGGNPSYQECQLFIGSN